MTKITLDLTDAEIEALKNMIEFCLQSGETSDIADPDWTSLRVKVLMALPK